MKISMNDRLEAAIKQAERLLMLSEKAERTIEAKQIQFGLDEVCRQRFLIGIVGQAKRGKSTLINGLLGRKDSLLAPIGRAPTSNAVSYFSWAEEERIKVNFLPGADGSEAKSPIDIKSTDVGKYVTEDENPGNRECVDSVEITGPFPGLEPGVSIVDTPGTGNAFSQLHDEILLEFLPKASALIFLVSADSPLIRSECDLLKRIRKEDIRKIFFVVNKTDIVDDEELEQGVAHNREMLEAIQFPSVSFHAISALRYFKTGADKGTEELIKAVHSLISVERLDILAAKLESYCEQAREALKLSVDEELGLMKRSQVELQVKKESLNNLADSIKKNTPELRRRFLTDWTAANNKFLSNLTRVRDSVFNDYKTMIEQTPDRELERLIDLLPSDIPRHIQECMEPHVKCWESELEAAQGNMVDLINQHVRVECDSTVRITRVTDGPADVGVTILSGLPNMLKAGVAVCIPQLASTLWGLSMPFGLQTLTAWGTQFFLGPIGAIVACGFLGAACLRMYRFNKNAKEARKNELISNVKSNIEKYFADMAAQVTKIADSANQVLNGVVENQISKIAEIRAQVEHLIVTKKPDEEREKLLIEVRKLIENSH